MRAMREPTDWTTPLLVAAALIVAVALVGELLAWSARDVLVVQVDALLFTWALRRAVQKIRARTARGPASVAKALFPYFEAEREKRSRRRAA